MKFQASVCDSEREASLAMNQDGLSSQLNQLSAYISTLREHSPDAPAVPVSQHAEVLAEAIETLQITWEELSVASEELLQQNAQLERAQIAIETERERYQNLFEDAPDAYIVTTQNGLIREANRAAAHLLAVAARFLKGKPLANFITLADRVNFRTAISDLQTNRRLERKSELSLRHGEKIPILCTVSAVTLRDEQGPGLRWILRDIRAQKQAESQILAINASLEQRVRERTVELEASEIRSRSLFSANLIGIAFFKLTGEVVLANHAFLQMIGREDMPADEGVLRLETLSHPRKAEQWEACMSALHLTGTFMPQEHELLQSNGAELPVLMGGTRLGPGQEEAVMFILDVSGRKAAETQLRQAQTELESRVSTRTEQLALANQALREEATEREHSEDARRELLRALVTAQEEERRRNSRELHDQLGQRLTAMMLGLQTLKEMAAPLSPALELLEHLVGVATDMGQEVHDLALELRPPALDDLGLDTTLTNYAEDWSHRSGIELDLHSRGLENCRLNSEVEITIYRVVQEALNNILKHAQARRVSLILECRETEVLVIVDDNGCGFNIPHSVPTTGVERRLGLVGMNERVAQVGGTLTVESEPGQGTTLFIRIPLEAGAHRSAMEASCV